LKSKPTKLVLIAGALVLAAIILAPSIASRWGEHRLIQQSQPIQAALDNYRQQPGTYPELLAEVGIADPKFEHNPRPDEDQSIQNKLAAARAQLKSLEISVYSNNPSLKAVEAYREAIGKWGLRQTTVTDDLSRFVAVADPIEAKKRSQAYMKAQNLMVPLVISDLSAHDTNFFAFFRTASPRFLSGETAWQILTRYDPGDRSATVPSVDERTFERYIEEANKRNQQFSDAVKQIADEAGMPTNALEAIRIDATVRLLRSIADMYKDVVTPPELVTLRREVEQLEILEERERAARHN
jgi:hypothetical protein